MNWRIAAALLSASGLFVVGASGKEKSMKQIRTYMSWSQPLDPAKIITIPDMDLSYALASTLVEWDQSKQIRKGLAESWSLIGSKTYRFKLRPGQKWSNGELITCAQVRESFERGMREHPEDLRSLIKAVERINCADNELEFVLKTESDADSLLGKLTEPNYGVLKIKQGKPDLSVSSGPFYVGDSSAQVLILRKNPNWYRASNEMADEVVMKKPPKDFDAAAALQNDPWPNLVETSSLMSGTLLRKYESEGLQVWKRPIDKVFLIRMSKRLENESGHQLLRYLYQTLDRELVLSRLSGSSSGEQIFPKGFQLYDPNFEKPAKKDALPTVFQKKPLEVMFCRARVSVELQNNISRAITKATGQVPKFKEIDVSEQATKILEGNFDLYVGTMGLADPDPEGVMSYYIENSPSVIPKSDGVYVKRLDQARKEGDSKKRIRQFQKILTAATLDGYVIPLFHLSTVGLGGKDLDFSNIPTSEESVTLSKIRFRTK